MARKVDQAKPSAAKKKTSAAEVVSALQPDATVTIAGKKITVREYGYFEGARVAHKARAFIADMTAACGGRALSYAAVRRLIGVHEDVAVAIAAQAADVETDWVRGLSRTELDLFFSTWFAVNASFFVQEVVVEIREAALLASMGSKPTASSSASPMPDSGTSTASAASPSVN